eukprot:TRINITY_DN8068_c0_g1_i2.p1 TRINITY_DN8068_c0_g1~~TRINITY_DN8068_c0_g1_i2.p1  ORF type:complete len:276 (-),score=46.95 TRINITY_DN8068_c0_g1_i2:355-1182(-)
MGKGRSLKRRIKNATDNLYGNLYKAQFGKANKNMRLGNAPKTSTFNKIPNSLRRLQQLQELAEKQEQGTCEDDQTNDRHVKNSAGVKNSGFTNQQPTRTKSSQEASKSISEVEKKHGKIQQKVLQEAGTERKNKSSKKLDGSIATKTSSKSQKRKLRMKQKKEEKVERLKAFAPHEKEHLIDNIKFGEQISAPPKINLKRKHWSAGDRCSKLFQEQMTKAELKLQQEKESLRWKVVDAYRGLKLKGKEPQKANMKSLKQLVQRTEEIQREMYQTG